MNIDTLFAVVATSALSSGLVVFLLKKWIEHSFSAKLAETEAKNRMQTHEHQIRFTRFDEKVTAAIEGAYEIVCEYSDALKDTIQKAYDEGTEAATDSLAQTDKVAHKFRSYMQRQSIYLSADMAEKLHATRFALRDTLTAELAACRAHKDRGESIAILSGVYQKHGLQKKNDALLAELQGMVREHLSRFVSKD